MQRRASDDGRETDDRIHCAVAFGPFASRWRATVEPLWKRVMEPSNRRKGQAAIFAGMVACAASVVLSRFGLDFLSGVGLGISLGLFFFGFRAFFRQ